MADEPIILGEEDIEEVVTSEETEKPEEAKPEEVLATALKELQETKLQLAELKGVVSATQKPVEEEIKDWLDDEEFSDEKIAADPASLKKMIKTLRSEVANVLRQRDEHLSGLVDKKVRGAIPRDELLEAKIEELRADDDYADFTDEQVERLARKSIKEVDPGQRSPRAPIGGRRINASVRGDDIKNSPLFREMYPEFVDNGGKK